MSEYRGYKRDGQTGLYVPEQLARKIGMGCPRCDMHFLQDPALGTGSDAASKFVAAHIRCGVLESLELLNGELRVTGPVELRFKESN